MSDLIICVDFDGTLCDHRFPDIGGEVPGAFHWLKQFQAAGAKLILWTMRSDLRNPADDGKGPTPGAKADRDYLTAAVEWCRERGVEFWGVNQNPQQHTWTSSPKQYAHIYIDDAALGCPLRDFPRMGSRPVVDWSRVGPLVMERLAMSPGNV
jgi:hypothetical protein